MMVFFFLKKINETQIEFLSLRITFLIGTFARISRIISHRNRCYKAIRDNYFQIQTSTLLSIVNRHANRLMNR